MFFGFVYFRRNAYICSAQYLKNDRIKNLIYTSPSALGKRTPPPGILCNYSKVVVLFCHEQKRFNTFRLMLNNIAIAIAPSARSTRWVNCRLSWATFSTSLSYPAVTDETIEEYFAMTRDEAGLVKDVGGYVGGFLRDGCRKKGHVEYRQLVTLDLDFAPVNFWEAYTGTRYEAVIHSTHSHTHSKPRYRLIIPLDREILPEEYERVSRVIAERLGRSYFDDTTFEPNRLMYYPSVARDGEYVFKHIQGEVLSADKALQVELQTPVVVSMGPVQADPRGKQGCVGVFCRAYTVYDAIEQLLPGVFESTDDPDRYTYVGSTTSKGLVIYDGGLFCYSHHSTDPAQGRGLNAFDLVRLHKFAHLDEGSEASGTGLPSYVAMTSYAATLPGFKKQAVNELSSDFSPEQSPIYVNRSLKKPLASTFSDWKDLLEVTGKGKIVASSKNVSVILNNDPKLTGLFGHNDFTGFHTVHRTPPWHEGINNAPAIDRSVGYRDIEDSDWDSLYMYICNNYGIEPTRLDRVFSDSLQSRKFHPVKEYLSSLTWDGVERLPSLLVKCFGAPDNIYTQEIITKMMVAAVSRVYKPGVQFDSVLVLVGGQGSGKSTFVRKLGKLWFTDSLTDVRGKEAYEVLAGAWIVELGELEGLRKAEVTQVKNFISKQDDKYRKAYGRFSTVQKRQCVFFGTTNDRRFLKDETGNRRFFPVEVFKSRATLPPYLEEFSEPIVDQLWAEALHLYNSGYSLVISPEAEKLADVSREDFYEGDELAGIVSRALDIPLPGWWGSMGLSDRRAYLSGENVFPEDPSNILTPRETVCGLEVWCDILGEDKSKFTTREQRRVSKIMGELTEWDRGVKRAYTPHYGLQRVYERINGNNHEN